MAFFVYGKFSYWVHHCGYRGITNSLDSAKLLGVSTRKLILHLNQFEGDTALNPCPIAIRSNQCYAPDCAKGFKLIVLHISKTDYSPRFRDVKTNRNFTHYVRS